MSPADWGKAGACRGRSSAFVDQAANSILDRWTRLRFGQYRRGKVARHRWRGGTMWGRAFTGLLLFLLLLAGYPYAALILNRALGTNTVVFGERDGLQRTLIMGPDAPRPDWLPILPRALSRQAGHWLPSPGREVAGDVELLTHKSVKEIKRFYLDGLGAAGFEMRDIGYGPLNAATAAYLGIDNTLNGYRSEARLAISVVTRSADGLVFPSRTVQIHWQTRD